jgi:hypothetical protein
MKGKEVLGFDWKVDRKLGRPETKEIYQRETSQTDCIIAPEALSCATQIRTSK